MEKAREKLRHSPFPGGFDVLEVKPESYENIDMSKEITRNSKILDIRSNNYVNEHRT